ncbi:MAG: tyrosine-type recombinase/integrase [Adlercreutzia equolifaciens]
MAKVRGEEGGVRGRAPHALRHTFATINLARGENIKTISVILGHASPSYTLDLYVGYIPSTSRELSNRYVSRLESLPQAA